MTLRFAAKDAARQFAWDRLTDAGQAREPLPPHGRIPNFAGARTVAVRLFEEEPWRSAGTRKINPDSPSAQCGRWRCNPASASACPRRGLPVLDEPRAWQSTREDRR